MPNIGGCSHFALFFILHHKRHIHFNFKPILQRVSLHESPLIANYREFNNAFVTQEYLVLKNGKIYKIVCIYHYLILTIQYG